MLQNEETESKAENWCSWEPEALPETMPDSMLQDNCPRMEEKSANKVALPMRVPEPAIKKLLKLSPLWNWQENSKICPYYFLWEYTVLPQ